MISFDPVIDSLAGEFEKRLGSSARVNLLPASGGWYVIRLNIIPNAAGAASVYIWQDNDILSISAGKSARFEIDEAPIGEMLLHARKIVLAVSEGMLVERSLGPLALIATLSPALRKLPFERRTRWQPYNSV